MRTYHAQTKQEYAEQHKKNLIKMSEWYLDQYQKYNFKFQSDISQELIEDVYNNTKDYDEITYSYEFDAILTPFCVADFLLRHILSTYSYGPEAITGHIEIDINNNRTHPISWFTYKADTPTLLELLQEYFNMNNEGADIELGVLLEERDVRSRLAHSGSIELCMSIIRFYNVIRKLFIFMDNEYRKILPEFVYPESISCKIQGVMGHFGFDDFQNRTTILVVGSMHDIPKEYQAYLASLPWNIVIDFDANSSHGGLRSTVNATTINERYWDLKVVDNISIRNNLTEWLKCGDFIFTTPYDSLIKKFPARKSLDLSSFPMRYLDWTDEMFHRLFRNVASEQNPVSILFMYYDTDILEILINNAEKHFQAVTYTISAVYYWGEKHRAEVEKNAYKQYKRYYLYNRNKIDYSDRFQFFPCSLMSFFEKLLEYSPFRGESVLDKRSYKLPSADGDTEIPLNMRMRLEKYFDVLYSDCGQEEYDVAEGKIKDFYSGALAPWCAYQNGEVVNLISNSDYDIWINSIKTRLGRIQKPDRKILYLDHLAGIGGTTMLRYLGWDLHKTNPVLVAQRYGSEVINVLQDLYDRQSKAFVVLVDENYNNIDDLIHGIKALDRPGILVVAQRAENNHKGNKEMPPLIKITNDAENQLKYKFKRISSLPSEVMREKDKQYATFIQTDSSMKSPFFIGLYYLDEEFKHLPDYVNQAFKGIFKLDEYKALGYISFCHIYGETTLPKVFINRILGIEAKKSFLDSNSFTKSLLFLYKPNEGPASYQSKHILISKAVLGICSEKLYGERNYTDVLAKWSEQFIDDMANELKIKYEENYAEILRRLFTRPQMSDERENDFSKLIYDISIPEYRVSTLTKLAEKIAEIASLNDPEQTPRAYDMAAHFYGHLGRLLSKDKGGVLNYEKAIENCKKALEFSEKCNHKDYSVYHMYGEVKRLSFNYQLQLRNGSTHMTTDDYKKLEIEVEDILKIFEISDTYGNHEYAQSSSISLLIDYLKFVYEKREIKSLADMGNLSESQYNYKMMIEDKFDSIDWEVLDENSKGLFKDLYDKYKSGIMYGDYSHMVEYHQNKLDYLLANKGPTSEICMHRSRLVSAKIAKMKTVLPNGKALFMSIPQKELDTILKLLEKTFEQAFDSSSFKERRNRCADYRRWVELAKYSERSVEMGIRYVNEWINLVEKGADHEPLPYYYRAVFYYLSALEGNVTSIAKAQDYSNQTCGYARDRNRPVSLNRIRDILVDGKGVGRLRDVAIFSDLGTLESYESIKPVVFGGRFEDEKSKRGTVLLKVPERLVTCKAKFNLDRNNSLTKDYITHEVEFYGGFCYEGIVAIDSSVIDVTTKETIRPVRIKEHTTQTKESMRSHMVENKSLGLQTDVITDFYPHDINYLPNKKDFFINGKVFGDQKAGLHSSNLLEYTEEFPDENEFADFICSLEKIKVSCNGPDKNGRYKVKIADKKISRKEMETYGSLQTFSYAKERDEEVHTESRIVEKHLESETASIGKGDEVSLCSIKAQEKCISGIIKVNGVEYIGKITKNVSPKQRKKFMKKQQITVKVIEFNGKYFIVEPVRQ